LRERAYFLGVNGRAMTIAEVVRLDLQGGWVEKGFNSDCWPKGEEGERE